MKKKHLLLAATVAAATKAAARVELIEAKCWLSKQPPLQRHDVKLSLRQSLLYMFNFVELIVSLFST